jgi:hypothetical protein
MPPRSRFAPTRLGGNPILHRDSTPGVGKNINGPSLIAAPAWIERPLGRYYLYFAHHRGTSIRLAVADDLEGPWRVHQPGALTLAESHFPTEGRRPHIASPDVHVDARRKTVRMYYHGLDTATRKQYTRVALSRDGVRFEALPETLGRPYFRAFFHDGWWYALGMPGILYRSADGLTGFERGPKLFENSMRHSALLERHGELHVFWSRVGDCPERILCSTVALEGDWRSWRAGPASEVLEPEEPWEGADRPPAPSVRGWVDEPVRQLRDPAVFAEQGRTYLLYSVAGESGIAIAALEPAAIKPSAATPRRRLQARATRLAARVASSFEGELGSHSIRQSAVAMTAVLCSFATALAIRHAAGLSSSIEILAVALALSLGRVGRRAEHRGLRARALALVLLPLVAVGANEIGTAIFRDPDLGDALFVLAVSATIWVRRFGELARRVATLATLPLVAMLIVPAPLVTTHGGGEQRLWTALVALLALAWVTLTQGVAERVGFIPATQTRLAAARVRSKRAPGRLAATTKMALQMGVALAGAFAIGRGAFGTHWTWVVLSAFIVCSGNRGREDVIHKAAMRLLGAGAGTLAATVIAGAFPAGDAWSIVVLFAVLSVAASLRPLSYAYWAAGMTAALALLYGYYGEHGSSLLTTRLGGIAIGAGLAVAASWLLMPIRSTDIMRRDVGAALAALDAYLAALLEDPSASAGRERRFRSVVLALEHHSRLLRGIPRRMRARIDHLPAILALERCAELLPRVTAALYEREPASDWEARIAELRTSIGELRHANGKATLPDSRGWNHLVDELRELPRVLAITTTEPAAPPDRFRASSEKVLAYANRVHGTAFELVAALGHAGASMTYSVADPSGRQARLTWSRDPTIEPAEAHDESTALAAGRTPSGYPYALHLALSGATPPQSSGV